MRTGITLRSMMVLAAAVLLSGCTLSTALRHDEIFSVWGPGRTLPTQLVFFATDRAPEGAGFGQSWGGAAHCGRAPVPIANAVSAPAPDPVLTPIACDGPAAMADFARQVAAAAAARHCNRVLAIVQGFNLTFRVALLHGAQVAMDSQWPCATLVIDWSSEGRFDRYAADIERSGYAVPVMIDLLRAIQASGLQTNILGHSMGARIALNAVGALCSAPAVLVDQMILAAADVSAEPGNDDFGRMLKRDAPCTRRITIYASDNDVALMASQAAHGGVERAGQLPRADMAYSGPGIDLVDASQAPSDISGHAYFVFSYEMATDMMWVLDGAGLAERAAKGVLACTDWSGGTCAAGTGRYSLKVAPGRRPDLGQRLIDAIAPIILPLQ